MRFLLTAALVAFSLANVETLGGILLVIGVSAVVLFFLCRSTK